MAVPTRDLAILRDQALKVIGFASRTIVHLDQRGWEEGLTFGDLTQAIDIIGELHARYYLLMTGKAKAMHSGHRGGLARAFPAGPDRTRR